jgi:hypothetical protein
MENLASAFKVSAEQDYGDDKGAIEAAHEFADTGHFFRVDQNTTDLTTALGLTNMPSIMAEPNAPQVAVTGPKTPQA